MNVQVIKSEPYGPGKFNTTFDQWLYEQSMDGCDSECGDVGEGGWYGLLLYPEGVSVDGEVWEGFIIKEDNEGFVYIDGMYKSVETAQAIFNEIEAESEF